MKDLNRKLILFSAFIVLWSAATVCADTKVLITVDVESYSKGNPDKQIWGAVTTNGELHGITKIMELLNANNMKGTFFLNVYEAATHGDSPLKLAAQQIHQNGHDLQLHTHPQPMFGVAQIGQADLETQVEILRKGVDLIYEWTGKLVSAHRAGAYGANLDTIQALRSIGVFADLSFSPVSNTQLSQQLPATNQPFVVNGVLEIPVTYYAQAKLGGWSSLRIVDIEASTIHELKEILKQAVEAELPVVNIMMHSFSFVRYGEADSGVETRFEELLEYIDANQQLKAVTITELMDGWRNDSFKIAQKDNIVPATGFFLTYLRAVEDYDKGTMNLIVAAAPLIAFAGILLFFAAWNRRSKQKYKPC